MDLLLPHLCVCVFMCACVCSVCLTHWIENHCKEELSATDAFVQLFGSTGVFFIVDGVSKQATCLTGQHLRVHTHTHAHTISIVRICVLHRWFTLKTNSQAISW